MVVPFGFSAGDFVSVIGLIVKVGKALRDVDGASFEYQQLDLELQGLRRMLDIIQALRPTDDNIGHLDAIRCLALTCQIPLTAFLQRLQKFEQRLGPFAKHSAVGGSLRKSQWALQMGEEVQQLRATVSAKVLSLTLLISVQNAETLGRVAVQTNDGLPKLFSKLESMSVEQTRFSSSIARQKDMLQQVGDFQKQLQNDFDGNTQQIVSKLDEANESNASMTRVVTSLTQSLTRALATVASMPQEVRDMLRRIAVSNFAMYGMLRTIQDHLSRSPCLRVQDSIMFEDALGRSKLLPYEYFQHFDMVDSFLRHHFKGLPGQSFVSLGAYALFNMQSGGSEIVPAQWRRTIFPGSKVQMALMVAEAFSGRGNPCLNAGSPRNLNTGRTGDRHCCECCEFQATNFNKDLPTAEVTDPEMQTAGPPPPSAAATTASEFAGIEEQDFDQEIAEPSDEYEDEDEDCASSPKSFLEQPGILRMELGRFRVFKRVHIRITNDPPPLAMHHRVLLDESIEGQSQDEDILFLMKLTSLRP
ncbi:hypothetical protein PV08_06778 [Exophiala spinifera]|uniref:Ubiquitin-like domain-containing protein n=1 Tax=Exophiala spinifera TaxID=91928 RepID=A0A0D1ZMI1_9EURO|nr:uncharacterized protein PV08_06778 [Exophiala spinifera]KIW13997.1 hypothetical protein PV08_06778 [Exophiala spinifera]